MEQIKPSKQSLSRLPENKGEFPQWYSLLAGMNASIQQIQQVISTPTLESKAILERIESLEHMIINNRPAPSVPLDKVEIPASPSYDSKLWLLVLLSISGNILLSIGLFLLYQRMGH